jgi:predicted nucleotidyltransferase
MLADNAHQFFQKKPGSFQMVMDQGMIKTKSNLEIPLDKIEAFCRKWKIKEFALFGSVLREDFRPDSDVDVLITFEPDGGFTFENFIEIQEEIEAIFGRKVDLVEKRLIRNPFRRHDILTTKEVVYAV